MTPKDDLGPLDFLVIDLPPGTRAYPRRVVREVTRLSESEFIRVVRFAMVSRGRDGSLTIEDPGGFSDPADPAGPADAADPADTAKRTTRASSARKDLDERLVAERLGQAAAGLPPGRAIGVLVYESLWANPLASAVRRSGGEWMGRGRLGPLSGSQPPRSEGVDRPRHDNGGQRQ